LLERWCLRLFRFEPYRRIATAGDTVRQAKNIES